MIESLATLMAIWLVGEICMAYKQNENKSVSQVDLFFRPSALIFDTNSEYIIYAA